MNMISIIVAIYNVEEYLDKCLVSIKKQTYQDIEVILIDDGSEDSSGRICDLYSKEDTRFKAFHIKNNGLAHARKFGFEKSKGNYIAFVDGDDWLEADYCNTLITSISKENADIAVCDFYLDNKPANMWKEAVFGTDMILDEYLRGGIYNRVWNKLYCRTIVENTEFSVGRDQLEDGFWTPQALAASNTIVRSSVPLYHYRIRPGSLMQKKKSVKEITDVMLNQIFRLDILCKNYERITIGNLQREYFKQIEDNILLGYDMDENNVLNNMRSLSLKYRNILIRESNSEVFSELLDSIIEASNTHELNLKYWKLILSQKDNRKNIMAKILECCKFCIRRIKNRKS